jgi:hypothetical protein
MKDQRGLFYYRGESVCYVNLPGMGVIDFRHLCSYFFVTREEFRMGCTRSWLWFHCLSNGGHDENGPLVFLDFFWLAVSS